MAGMKVLAILIRRSTSLSQSCGVRWETPPTTRDISRLFPGAAKPLHCGRGRRQPTLPTNWSSPTNLILSATEERARSTSPRKWHDPNACLGSMLGRFFGLAIVSVLLILMVSIFLWRSARKSMFCLPAPFVLWQCFHLKILSSNSEDYFADGMTDELITDLAQISSLRVISRTSVMQYQRRTQGP